LGLGDAPPPIEQPSQNVVIEIANNKATVTIPSISEGTAAIIPISDQGGFMIRSVEIGAAKTIGQAELAIEILDGKPAGRPDVNGSVYGYLSISTNINPDDVLYAKMDFGIPKTWLENNQVDADSVGMLSVTEGEWSIVSSTNEVADDGTDIVFSADLPNLTSNDYAISGNIPAVTTTTTQVSTSVTTVTTSLATVTTTATPVVTQTVTTTVSGENTLSYLAIGVAVIAVVILVLVFRSSRRT
jgi:PGF-pre-PGF domain-containing protein